MGDRKMKKKVKFMLVVFTIGIFLATGFVSVSYFYNERALLKKVSDELSEVAKDKSKKIHDYLSGLEKDIQFLQESPEVENLLKKDLVFDEDALKKNVEQRARIITKEVENYIRAHPEVTLKDLQKSDEFQKIAVQPIGKEGYSASFEAGSLISYFHKDPNIVDFDLHTLEESNPEFFGIISRIKDGEEIVDDFYDWKESSGEIRKKYGSFRRVPVKTADSKSLTIGTTAYIDEYKTIDTKSKLLENFNRDNDYHDIVLITPEGYVSYMAYEHLFFGTNIEWESNLEEGVSVNYFEVKENKEILFHGPFLEEYGHIYPLVSIMAPVYENNKLLGYIAIVENMDHLFSIAKEIVIDYETKESYLVDSERLLISPLRSGDFDIMVQSVETENVEECIEDLEEKGVEAFEKEFEEKEEGDLRISENYEGNLILGTDFPFPELGWCLLVEVEKEEVINVPLKEIIKNRIYFSVIGVLVLTLIGFFVGDYFDKKGSKIPQRILKKRNFFANLKLRNNILFGVFLSTLYIFLNVLFIKGWDEAWVSFVPYGLILIISIMLFMLSFKIEKAERKYLLWGACSLILAQVINIPFVLIWQTIERVSTLYFTLPIILDGLGISMILIYLRRRIK